MEKEFLLWIPLAHACAQLLLLLLLLLAPCFKSTISAVATNRGNVTRYRRSVEGARVPHSSEDRSPSTAAIVPAN